MKQDRLGNKIYDEGDIAVLLNVIKNKMSAYKEYALLNDKSELELGVLAGKVIECCYSMVATSFNETIEFGEPRKFLDSDEKNFIL